MIPVAVVPESRPLIHQRVERRFEAMLEHGFIDEVRSLMSQSRELLPAFRAVGYFEIWQYLNNEIGYDEMVDKAVAASRQLAKKQFTWLNDWPEVTRFTGTNVTNAAAQILQYMESVAIISGPLGKS
jgi:tRNA dimethylallyltransferase